MKDFFKRLFRIKLPTLEEYLNTHCIECDCQGDKVWIQEYYRLYEN